MGTTNMDDMYTTKFISLLLLVFPLFTEATHGVEYSYTVVFMRAKFLSSGAED